MFTFAAALVYFQVEKPISGKKKSNYPSFHLMVLCGVSNLDILLDSEFL